MNFSEHINNWLNCQNCDLCAGRKNVVFARGEIPCDLLFVGEAPGESEDSLGVPFVGPAGHLLNTIIGRALPEGVSYAITNLVCCIPREDGRTTEPLDEHILACGERLQEFIGIAKPKIVIALGKLAQDYLGGNVRLAKKLGNICAGIEVVNCLHPSAILRANLAQRSLAIQRCVVVIKNAAEKLLEERLA